MTVLRECLLWIEALSPLLLVAAVLCASVLARKGERERSRGEMDDRLRREFESRGMDYDSWKGGGSAGSERDAEREPDGVMLCDTDGTLDWDSCLPADDESGDAKHYPRRKLYLDTPPPSKPEKQERDWEALYVDLAETLGFVVRPEGQGYEVAEHGRIQEALRDALRAGRDADDDDASEHANEKWAGALER